MATFSLNRTDYSVPASKADFTGLVEKLTAAHSGLREKALLFFMRATNAEGGESVASMVGEGKYGTLHLLFELAGRPDLAKEGWIERTLSATDLEALLSAFSPFMGDGQSHPNIEFLKRARESRSTVTLGIIAQADAESKNRPAYMKFRTNSLFDLFNEGALRGSDGVARQSLLDSFSYLPNNFLTAEGRFLVAKGQEGALLRGNAGSEELRAGAGIPAFGGIDKFPSLLSLRGERLQKDGNRVVPSVMIRDGVHVGKRNIFMFHAAVNIAAFIGDDNMIDSHASVASAAQIGNKNKIGSFVSLEGVLSPANAVPVYIGDENFIGSFARIGTGLIVGNKNFIGAGVNLSKGTKLKDCREGSATRGDYVNVQELNGNFNNLAIAPNNALRDFNGVKLAPGEFILFENSEEFMRRFEGDDRIKAK
jgi:2,3,4,5-tetrahydropyridine-2-carboxylate N-succinyltransferase